MSHLPEIPLHHATAVELTRLEPVKLADLLRIAERSYTGPAIRLGDAVSRRWLRLAGNPYLAELEAIAGQIGRPGAHLLNVSFEWACTTSASADPCGGSRLLRVLDWKLDGLGRNLVVARQSGPAGEFYNITWPGFVGVLTAMAPGRFAAAINQPPLRSFGLPLPLAWVANKRRLWQSLAMPPAHLLRKVFEDCRSYDEAKRMLSETPLCLPVFFTLSGAEPDEGCVIERVEDRCVVHPCPAAVANHWLAMREGGAPRGYDSPGRHRRMCAVMAAPHEDFAWLQPPILNPDTRLVVYANAAKGALRLQGWERHGPATAVFEHGAAQSYPIPTNSSPI